MGSSMSVDPCERLIEMQVLNTSQLKSPWAAAAADFG